MRGHPFPSPFRLHLTGIQAVEQSSPIVFPLPQISMAYPRASRSPFATIESFGGKPCRQVDSAADGSMFHSSEVGPTIFRCQTRNRLSCVDWGMVRAAKRLEQTPG